MAFNNSIRESNIKVFEDTCLRIKTSKALQDSIKLSNKSQDIILEKDTIDVDKVRFPGPVKIHITKSRSFDAAREYTNGKVAVHNFASATNPGGGVVKGSSAQEECLCRCSTLYKNLTEQECYDKFYTPHRQGLSALHNDDIIYTPDVVIFKDDDYNYLNPTDWMKVDIITCAAPNLRENPKNEYNAESSTDKIDISDDELYQLHLKRAKRIMDIAAYKGADILILGAFGCGAFRNNPKVVAKAYKDAVADYRHAFKEIEFAIYCGSAKDEGNYTAFKEAFGR